MEGWLPNRFVPPLRVELGAGEHLRPIREVDVEIDFPAVIGSRERLWETYGEAWGWPPADLTFEDDRGDLARHERENGSGGPFNYAVLNADESALLGCVYIDPPDAHAAPACEAVVSWWLVDDALDGELEQALADFVPSWLARVWRFENVEFRPWRAPGR